MQYTSEQLQGVLQKHAAWVLRDDGGERANLRLADLRGADLTGADLSGANLTGADLSKADLSRATGLPA